MDEESGTEERQPQYLSQEDLEQLALFHPYAHAKTTEAMRSKRRFVHYTSADTAMRIIQGRQVWMRNANCMNDFSEIQHGFSCLHAAFTVHRAAMEAGFDTLFPGFTKELADSFDSWLPHFRSDTYITCLSEHDDEEDELGRLSMWRAYGGDSGVALVLNPQVFLVTSDALRTYTAPVRYQDRSAFVAAFGEYVAGMAAKPKVLRALGKDDVLAHVFHEFRYAILCTKHPGFQEEREWRIIYSPIYARSERLIPEVVSIAGIPQPIFKLPLADIPAENLIGAEIPKLLDRLIIGPTQFPLVTRQAFLALLIDAGVEFPTMKIYASDIPLRR